MPIYEYNCTACKADFEQLVRNAAEAQRVTCPKCGQATVQRRMSVPAAPRAVAPVPLPRGGCGRCGDPNGPCGLD